MAYKVFIISLFLVSWTGIQAQDQVTYIRKYQDLAIAEMMRTGIPASIKLAQAILESNCGQSELACKANNHFGIKCGGSWNGKAFHKEDDDYTNGKLVKSCFREFDSVRDSYIAHSDFLADPGKATRYGSLFLLDRNDYKGWAKGLSKAGYATDPQYANRLIEIIEKYELFRFDNEYEHMLTSDAPPSSAAVQLIKYTNDVKYTRALQGDNAKSIAQRNEMSVTQLMRYNENIVSKDQALEAGEKVYLESKKSKNLGKQKYHVLKEGEDLADISSLYGIKLESLLKRNGLHKNEVPAPKQKIMLKGKTKTELRTVDPYETPGKKKTTSQKPSSSYEVNATQKESDQSMASVSTSPGAVSKTSSAAKESMKSMHTVMKGDTLYGIARAYGLSVADLKMKNNLSADTIFVGQKLVFK
jgi:LysM repeat protein